MFQQIKKISTFFLAAGFLSSALVSCKKDNTDDSGDNGGGGGTAALSITTKIKQDSELSYINSALGIAGLADTLSKAGEFTFFAPVNAALDSLGIVIKDTSDLTASDINGTLRYHILKGTYRTADIPAGADNKKYYTISIPEDSVFITKAPNNSIYVNGVKVDDAKKDITVGNGVIHKLVNNKATNEYGFLYSATDQNIYDFLKGFVNTGENPGVFDSIVKMIDKASTVDPEIKTALQSNIVTFAVPVDDALVPFIKSVDSINGIKAIPAITIANIIRNHIVPSRKFLINFAIGTNAGGVATLSKSSADKLKYGLAPFGGTELTSFYLNLEAAAPIIPSLSDLMFKNGVLHVIAGVITNK